MSRALTCAVVVCLTVAWGGLLARGDGDGSGSSNPVVAKAAAALAAGKLHEAEALYLRLRRQGVDVEEELQRITHLKLLRDARAAVEAGELDKAHKLFGRANDERPGGPSLEIEREQFRVYLKLKAAAADAELGARSRTHEATAEAHALASRWGEAVASFTQALESAVDPARRAALSRKLGKAKLELLKVTERTSMNRDLTAARRLFGEERWQEAVRMFRRAAAVAPLSKADQGRLHRARQAHARQTMVRIPAGEVVVGSTYAPDEVPRHRRRLPAFWIDRHEVTNGQYARFVHATKHAPPEGWKGGRPRPGTEKLPVTGVSHEDASRYARWAGKRLPTEAEWVRAARADRDYLYPWGEFFRTGRCNAVEMGNEGPVAIGRYPKGVSPFGIHDLLGNVLEWTASEYAPYPGARWTVPADAPTRYVLRGGAWYFPANKMRIGVRYHDDPAARVVGYGFRCAMAAAGRK